ncbi:Chaperone protein dnaJ 8 [Nymphaea thermarum]|nr:Chaperone protein dnaJ 8 [Nymphaea thermarum]
MAASMGKVSGGRWVQVGSFKEKPRARKVRTCVARLRDQYRTLRVEPGASEKEVRKAFRQLALQYHPDVCKGNDCGVQFHRINEAYDVVMSSFREEEPDDRACEFACDDDQMRGMYDSSWDMWEEWMGWEGAGIRDYSSHINPYI